MAPRKSPPPPTAGGGVSQSEAPDRAVQYLATHPLTAHLKAKYPADVQQVAAVRIRPVIGVDPSAWPMVSATGLPHGVPWHLVRAHALLHWTVHESNPDQAALDSAIRLIHESELQLLADIGLKHVLAGRKGRAQQKKDADGRRTDILSTFDRLRGAQPAAAKIEPIVAETAAECCVSTRTVWRYLGQRAKELTASGPD